MSDDEKKILVARARRIQFFLSKTLTWRNNFTQSSWFLCTNEETVKGFAEILARKYDDLPTKSLP